MTDFHKKLVETNSKLFVTIAGAGTELLQRIWSKPGVSKNFVGARMPQSETQLMDCLGGECDANAVSENTALELAMYSYLQCLLEASTEDNPVGLGMTAAVASDRMPRGDQRAHIAVMTKTGVVYKQLNLVKDCGVVSRAKHDKIVSSAALSLLERALLGDNDLCYVDRCFGLLHGNAPTYSANGLRDSKGRGRDLYLPATLNPLHDGHRNARRAGEKHTEQRATYLVSTVSPHKGKMPVQQCLGIIAAVKNERYLFNDGDRNVEFTLDEPLFIDKARARPNSTFIIGADTMQRMLDPKWGPEIIPMLDEMRALGTKFLVIGRAIDGVWTECRDIKISWPNQLIFCPIQVAPNDISSTKIREAQANVP